MVTKDIPLGRASTYSDRYDNSLLFPVKRSEGRLKIPYSLPNQMCGHDLWNCYELSWLDSSGKPHSALCRISYDCMSPYIVESKSLKLYLNSLNGTKYSSADDVAALITRDLSRVTGDANLTAQVIPLSGDEVSQVQGAPPNSLLIDDLSPSSPGAPLSSSPASWGEEYFHSHLLRSLCPVTGQPDWASVFVYVQGPKLSQQALLSYIISLRNHQGFHEECTELIFSWIFQEAEPQQLAVGCFFTRRGGIDINPLRYTAGAAGKIVYRRQLRQ